MGEWVEPRHLGSLLCSRRAVRAIRAGVRTPEVSSRRVQWVGSKDLELGLLGSGLGSGKISAPAQPGHAGPAGHRVPGCHHAAPRRPLSPLLVLSPDWDPAPRCSSSELIKAFAPMLCGLTLTLQGYLGTSTSAQHPPETSAAYPGQPRAAGRRAGSKPVATGSIPGAGTSEANMGPNPVTWSGSGPATVSLWVPVPTLSQHFQELLH